MQDDRTSAGQLLRRLRQQRGLKLKEAATLMSSSSPTLSRKERGADLVTRLDVRQAIAAYRLSPWEAYELWTTAGLIPEPTVGIPRSVDPRTFAETLLPNIPFPAFLMDALCYVIAWNEGLEAIWAPSQTDGAIHVIADLFSDRQRVRLGQRWEPYVSQALQIFYYKTLRVANEPRFRELLDGLATRHPDTFVSLWNRVQQGVHAVQPLPPVDVGAAIVPYESPLGPIDYLVLESTLQIPQPYELIVYVPYGAEHTQRYQRWRETMGTARVFFRL